MMKNCRQCQTQFEITSDDLKFYDTISPIFAGKKYSILPPTFCPDCRLQRRMSWRNERFLYTRNCDKCKKNIVSVHSQNKPFPVYCNKCWWSDDWNANQYGKSFDFSRPFFDQLRELMDKVPQLAIQNDNGTGSINSEFCQDASHLKNCYLVVGTWYTEDSFYCSINSSHNRNICDCINISKSELCYESIDSQGLYNCAFVQNSENCSDCFFGFDLKGCKNCFGCIGLRQKQFYIFNEPYSEEEYKKKIATYNLDSSESLAKFKAEYFQWIIKYPRKNMNLQNCENSEGNDLLNCKNTYGFSLLNSENCKYCHQGDENKFSYDISNSGRPNWCYEGITPDNSYMNHFSWFSWANKYLFYCINCHSSEYLFGCVSLHRGKYCILNKQYTKEEYEALVPKIIEHMKKTGEWSEFPDTKFSFFGYNETISNEYFPLTQAEVEKRGWSWQPKALREYEPQTCMIPDSVKETPETITKEILSCINCTKNYKIIPQELVFYQKMGLPVPRKCSNCRHMDRLNRRNPYKLWQRSCAKCNKAIKTSYAPNRPEIIYCEECYLKEVY